MDRKKPHAFRLSRLTLKPAKQDPILQQTKQAQLHKCSCAHVHYHIVIVAAAATRVFRSMQLYARASVLQNASIVALALISKWIELGRCVPFFFASFLSLCSAEEREIPMCACNVSLHQKYASKSCSIEAKTATKKYAF